MTSVNLVPDDVGLQRLRADDEKPAATSQVSGVSPSRPVSKNRAADEKIQAIHSERRQRHERRIGLERRKQNRPVFLDTRTNRERRKNNGKRSYDPRYRTGINITV